MDPIICRPGPRAERPQRQPQPSWIVRAAWALFALIVAAILLVGSAHAQISQQECSAYGDAALIAAAMTLHGVPESTQRAIIAELYTVTTDRARRALGRALALARSGVAAGRSPIDVARGIASECVSSGGRSLSAERL